MGHSGMEAIMRRQGNCSFSIFLFHFFQWLHTAIVVFAFICFASHFAFIFVKSCFSFFLSLYLAFLSELNLSISPLWWKQVSFHYCQFCLPTNNFTRETEWLILLISPASPPSSNLILSSCWAPSPIPKHPPIEKHYWSTVVEEILSTHQWRLLKPASDWLLKKVMLALCNFLHAGLENVKMTRGRRRSTGGGGGEKSRAALTAVDLSNYTTIRCLYSD